MVIDSEKYPLDKNNFIAEPKEKKKIVLAHTFNNNMKHYYGWLHRYNGKYDKTAPFTIAKDGSIYQHFDPSYYSKFLANDQLNFESVVILLENEGWLIKDIENDRFITWIGDIYKESDNVSLKRWRNYTHWCQYSQEQFDSTVWLVKMLCKKFEIPLLAIGHNTKIDEVEKYNGVLYRSNIDKNYTDLNPTWDCQNFKTKIENERENQ